jgi:hypothetical protein
VNRSILRAVLALLLLLLLAPAEAAELDFLFLQPDRQAGWGDASIVAADLDRAARRGVDTVVLQYVGHGEDDLLLDGFVGTVLDLAQQRGLQVWIGTWEDPAIWRSRTVPLGRWRKAAEAGVAAAARVAAQHGRHPAFAGWYWTPEAVWWNPPGRRRLESLTAVTADAVRKLRALADKPVAITLGPSGRGEGNLLMGSWCRYVEGVEPDVVVAMDGVGSGHLDVALLPGLYSALRTCADRAGARLWADLEVFSPDLATPPAPERLRRQAEATGLVDAVGAFDLSHHLRRGPASAWWEDRPDRLRVLRDGPPRLEPPRDWRARPALRQAQAVVSLPGSLTVERVEFVLRGNPARSVTLSSGAQELGALVRHHGPGRDEETWVWTGRATAARFALTVRLGRGGAVPVTVRLHGP